MYQLNETIEKMILGKSSYIGNFDNGILIKLEKDEEKIIDKIRPQTYCSEEDFGETPDLLKKMKESGCFETVEQPLATAYLHITNICNLNCIGCYSYDRTRNCQDKLSFENIKYIIAQLAENGVDTLTISGGEPMIRQELVEIARYAKEIGIETLNIITNGTLFDEEKLKGIKPYVDALPVSIDGYSETNPQFIRDEGTFPKVIEFVKRAKAMGLPISILPTLHQYNIGFLDEYMKLSKKLQVPISFSLLTCSGELADYIPSKENLDYLAEYFIQYMGSGMVPLQDYSMLEARKSCGAGKSIISISANGNVYPCHMMHTKEVIMGNVLETPLKEILERENKVPSVDEICECENCSVKNLCGGGCKARALLIKGSLQKPDPYCELNLKFYSRFIEEKMKCEGSLQTIY